MTVSQQPFQPDTPLLSTHPYTTFNHSSGKPVTVRNRQRPIDIAFNLDYPEGAPVEVDEIEDDYEKPIDENNDVPDEDIAEDEPQTISD